MALKYPGEDAAKLSNKHVGSELCGLGSGQEVDWSVVLFCVIAVKDYSDTQALSLSRLGLNFSTLIKRL